jgi:hypothetical protein
VNTPGILRECARKFHREASPLMPKRIIAFLRTADGEWLCNRGSATGMPAGDFRIELPDMKINERAAKIPPIDFKKFRRTELMAPFNRSAPLAANKNTQSAAANRNTLRIDERN